MCCSFRELWDDDHTTHYWCSTGKNLSWTRRARSFIGLGWSGSLSNMVSQVSHICSIVKGSSSAMSSWTCGWAAKGVHPSGGPWTWPTTAGCTQVGLADSMKSTISTILRENWYLWGQGDACCHVLSQIQWDGGAVRVIVESRFFDNLD